MTDPAVAYLPDENYGPFDRGAEMDVWIKAPNGSASLGLVWPGVTVFPGMYPLTIRPLLVLIKIATFAQTGSIQTSLSKHLVLFTIVEIFYDAGFIISSATGQTNSPCSIVPKLGWTLMAHGST